MPADIPGFYFDAEKNRYFKILPGQNSSGRAASGSHASSSGGGGRGGRRGRQEAGISQEVRLAKSCFQRKKQRQAFAVTPGIHQLSEPISNLASLLRTRELVGSLRAGSRGWGQRKFQQMFIETDASHTQIWEYQKAEGSACTAPTDKALYQLCTHTQTPEGVKELSVLLSGDSIGCVSVWKPTTYVTLDELNEWVLYPQRLGAGPLPRRPITSVPQDVPPLLDGRHPLSCGVLDSPIAGISPLHAHGGEPDHSRPVVAITTMGGSSSGGVVRLMTFSEDRTWGNYTFSGFDRTIWAATSSPSAPFIALAASKGATMLAYEEGRGLAINRRLCKSDSDALAAEFDNEGKVVLCGFRNGAISTIDLRQPSPKMTGPGMSGGQQRGHAGAAPHSHRGGKMAQQRMGQGRHMKRIVDPMYCSHSAVMIMPSSITSIVRLPSNDNYIIAAAMDGSLWRWDRRSARGAVLRYEGHVNSHTFLPCALDPSETLLFAGGEDSEMRVWSVSTGRLLSSVPDLPGPITALGSLAVPERRPTQALCEVPPNRDEWWGRPAPSGWYDWWSTRTHPWGLWLGSEEKLMYMCGGTAGTLHHAL